MKSGYFVIVILWFSGFVSGKSYCQTKNPADSVEIKKVSAFLSIDYTSAGNIVQAMHMNDDQINALVHNKNIKPQNKHAQIIGLLEQRESKIRSMLNSDQQARFNDMINNDARQIRQGKKSSIASKRKKAAQQRVQTAN